VDQGHERCVRVEFQDPRSFNPDTLDAPLYPGSWHIRLNDDHTYTLTGPEDWDPQRTITTSGSKPGQVISEWQLIDYLGSGIVNRIVEDKLFAPET
jgi:hypothetical protein